MPKIRSRPITKQKKTTKKKAPEPSQERPGDAFDGTRDGVQDAQDDGQDAQGDERNNGPLANIPSDGEIRESRERARHRDFNGWMEEYRRYVEDYPDHFFFRVMRTHPKHDRDGAPMAGPIEYYNRPFYLEELRKQLPEGGRFDVELVGPIRTQNGGIKHKVIRAAFRSLELPDLRDRMSSSHNLVTPKLLEGLRDEDDGGSDEDDDKDGDEDERGRGSGRYETPPFVDQIVRSHFQDVDHKQRKLEEYERELRKRSEYQARDRRPSRNDEMTSTLMKSLVDIMQASIARQGSDGEAKFDREEMNRLHEQITKAQEEHRRVQEAHQRDTTERLQTQAREWQDRMEDLRKSYEKLMSDLRERYDSEIGRLRESNNDKVEALQERYREAREDLTSSRSTVETLRANLAQAQAEANRVQSELAALKTTKDADIRAAVIEAERRVEQSAKPKKDEEDPLEGMVRRVKKARELSETLGETLGGGPKAGGAEGEKKEGIGKSLVDIARSLAGSDDFRKITGEMARGVSAAVSGAAAKRSGPVAPSTAAVAAAYQQSQASGLGPAQFQAQAPAPVPDPEPTLEPMAAEPPAVADATAREVGPRGAAGDRAAAVEDAGNDMLDAIEDHSTLGTPLDEAAQDVIGRLSRSLGVTEGVVRENIKGASAEKTLEELGFPPSRLTPEATAYLNQLIAHVSHVPKSK